MEQRERDWADALEAERAGDRDAYARFLREFAAALRRQVRRKLLVAGLDAQEAEDVIQEVLLAVHAKRDQWDSGRPLMPWLAAISHYKVVDAVRRRHADLRFRVALREEEWLLLRSDEPEAPEVSRHEVEELVAELPPVQQSVVRQIGLDGAPVPQVAANLGMKQGAVRVAFHRGLARLVEIARRRAE